MRHTSFDYLCPKHRAAFEGLERAVRPFGLFVFETYRSPEEQNAAFERGASRARAGQSPHQHGFAVDFVPRQGARGWYWPPASHSIWRTLRFEAQKLGLHNDLAWDRPHVECRCWRDKRSQSVQWKSAVG